MRTFSYLRFALPLAACSVLFGQYKTESAGAPPAEVAPAIAKVMQADGVKITNNGKPYCEIWFRSAKPAGKSADENQTLTGISMGTLLGVIRFDGPGKDRQGQGIKPGVYTLRYGLIPINGDHQGAAPQRDFVLMIPAANDSDADSTPTFDQIVDMSRKASGTPHPAILSLWKADTDGPVGISKQGENDWVLQDKLGDTPISMIVIGTVSS